MALQLRVLVVDDSTVFRTVLSGCVSRSKLGRVVAHAADGKEALARATEFKPDLITLDLEMPVMGGLQALPLLKQALPKCAVVILSSVTRVGAALTMKAIELGAFDFIPKPFGDDAEENQRLLDHMVVEVMEAVQAARVEAARQSALAATGTSDAVGVPMGYGGSSPSGLTRAPTASPSGLSRAPASSPSGLFRAPPAAPGAPAKAATVSPLPPAAARPSTPGASAGPAAVAQRLPFVPPKSLVLPEVVAIGASTGGPNALATVLSRLPKDFRAPVLVVQHMPPLFTSALVKTLTEKCKVAVKEAADEMPLAPGTVYVAPGGKHLVVVNAEGGRKLKLTEDPPEHFCRPAVDVLFRSVAEAYRERALGVILTGMGKDGTKGLLEMRKHGVKVIGQAAASCAVYGMPREAMLAGAVDVELAAEDIAQEIVTTLSPAKARG